MRVRRIFALLALGVMAVAPMSEARAQDLAEEAWARGDRALAARLYAERLAADSADVTALHRVALSRAWSGELAESLRLFDRLLAREPENLGARVDRARVLAWQGDVAAALEQVDAVLARDPVFFPALQARAQLHSWAGEYDEALRGYDRILEALPGDPAATLGVAQVLAWAGRADSAEAVYRRLLEHHPGNAEALRGLARTAVLAGRLGVAERRWRSAIEADPGDAAAFVGLAQTLFSQGREGAAWEAAQRAVRLAPTDRDARAELERIRLALAPRVGSSAIYETDSDGNRVVTTTLTGRWRPAEGVELRGDVYRRAAAGRFAPDAWSSGATLTTWLQRGAGWSASGTLGVTALGAEGADPVGVARAGVQTPARSPLRAGISVARYALDATALLIRNRVRVDEVEATATWAPAGVWTVTAGVGGAELRGGVTEEPNRRLAAQVGISRRIAPPLFLGVGARAFGFEEELAAGYFAPDLYALAEGVARYVRESDRWILNAELAPGVQRVGSAGEARGALRASGSLAYVLAPGRQVTLTAAFANAALQQLSPGDPSDYRYGAVGVSGSWAF